MAPSLWQVGVTPAVCRLTPRCSGRAKSGAPLNSSIVRRAGIFGGLQALRKRFGQRLAPLLHLFRRGLSRLLWAVLGEPKPFLSVSARAIEGRYSGSRLLL